jgi:hypothetical protein
VPTIASLDVADPPEVWAALGFALDDDGGVWMSGLRLRLGVGPKRISAWALRDYDGPVDIDGLATATSKIPAQARPYHPNGVVTLDHLVVMTPDIVRTTATIEAAGLELRRTRDTDQYGPPFRQTFFKLGEVVLEVIGPVDPRDDGPARFYGLAFTVGDLDETAAFLGDRLHAAKDAVQPGRRIATLDRGAGSSIPIAFMSPGVMAVPQTAP